MKSKEEVVPPLREESHAQPGRDGLVDCWVTDPSSLPGTDCMCAQEMFVEWKHVSGMGLTPESICGKPVNSSSV